MIFGALVFALFIIAIIVAANTDSLPFALKRLYRFPGGDKVGHFILFGILSFLLNKSALILLPRRDSARVTLTMSLLLAILIGLEEWSQSLFPSRTMSLIDLIASYAGVFVFALLAYWTKR
ncbi:MAG: VanZ family protein [Anaerolineales bacterium]|nr:VanZ family protein [Anaerolineales bacterium]